MAKIPKTTKRILILGIVLFACLGVLVGKHEVLLVATAGFLTLLKGDD